MSISRFNAVEKASNRKAVEAVTPEHKVSEYYGENVFNRKAMQKYLSKETYKALTHAIDNDTASLIEINLLKPTKAREADPKETIASGR